MTESMLKPRWDLFVFDWDGTVMDTTALIAMGLQQACGALGYEVPSFEAARKTIGLGMADTMAAICPQCPASRWDEFTAAYKAWYIRREAQTPLVPGMRELLTAMHGAGLRLAIATGKSRAGLDRVFALTGLEPLFEETITADESFSKPNPAMLLELSDRCGVECARMVMVGDAIHDTLMAKNAGAAGIGVTFAGTSAEEFAPSSPVAVVDNTRELAAALGVSALGSF